ncbi:hypothetical protein JOB18_033666 [Solea senegalensis]|uniref:Uncharacterized protein n=1 Tax=Solea senegalensis TaxID=28829 RepID=A0AAV6SAK0_SOLSE|nr:PDZK1-interacting protein 1 isoform X2 [Solea senegalensis]KAG7514431.1 hypothetical protein JOB18_033666 [Solea senegalensis]
MKKISALTSCLLLIIGAVTAQTAEPEVGGRPLPQWLTGLLALAGFLFLTFVAFLVKAAWCGDTNKLRTSVESATDNDYVINDTNTYDTTLDEVRSKDRSAYDTTLDAVRSKDRSAYDTTLDAVRDDRNAYDNLGIDDDTYERVTSM